MTIDWNTSAKEAESAIAESHFGVQPSMEREAFGLENLRYMRCGRAQVCLRQRRAEEFLADGVTALFVPPADAHALAEAMRRLASDQTLRRRLGENARKEFDIRLSWDIFTRRMRKIYYNELNIEGDFLILILEMEKDSKIFVAGHRGMVGSAIVRELRRQGYVNIITRTHAGLDLTDQRAVEEFFAAERPEYVFLAAAKVGGIVANSKAPADFMYVNMMLEMNVINAAWRHGCRKLEFLGSSCIYPRMAPQPMPESSAHLGTRADQRGLRPRQDLGAEVLRIPQPPVRHRLHFGHAHQSVRPQ